MLSPQQEQSHQHTLNHSQNNGITLPNITLGLNDRSGILFHKAITIIQTTFPEQWSNSDQDQFLNSIEQVSLVHEHGFVPELVTALPFIRRGVYIVIQPFDDSSLKTENMTHDPMKSNKWMILVKSNAFNQEFQVTIRYICKDSNDMAKNPLEYWKKSYPLVAGGFSQVSIENCDLLNSLFRTNVSVESFSKFFGKSYPLVCKVKRRWLKDQQNDGKFEIVGDGTNQISILNSFSRFSRIFMSLNLGKCLMVVKFDFQSDLRTLKESKKEYCISYGINYEGHKYELFATSNSGFKGDTCIFFNSSILNIEALKAILGTFGAAERYGARKVASRVGLSMGTSLPSFAQWKEDEIAYIPDEFAVTDGAGMAVDHFFEEILEKTYSIPFFEVENLEKFPELKQRRMFTKDYKSVSAMQIRMLGAKGVIQKIPKLMWSQLLKKMGLSSDTKIILRESMVKFKGNYSFYNRIDVLNISEILGGNINRTTMSCLIEMTDRRNEMEELFMKHFDAELHEIVENKDNPMYLCNVLLSQSENSKGKLAKELIMGGHQLDNFFISKVVKDSITKKFQSMIDDRLCFKMKHPNFVSLMGVFDEGLTLKEDEVYINCSKLTESPDYSQIDRVLVYRNPLAYEGDIQCLKLVKEPSSEFLQTRKDVIVFGHGSTSDTSAPLCYMASGDLDGDLYEIVFDPEIVKLFIPNHVPKLNYNTGAKPVPISCTGLEMNLVRGALFDMMTELSEIGQIYSKTVDWRFDVEKSNTKIKQQLSKMYHDSIDKIKGGKFDKKQFVPTRERPDWINLGQTSIEDTSIRPEPKYFESRMYIKIKKIFEKIEWNANKELDPDFIELSKDYSDSQPTWKIEFDSALQAWNAYWSSVTKEDIFFSDKNALHKKKLYNRIKECMNENNKVDWYKLFIGTDGRSLDRLLNKAAYWMYYAYMEFGSDMYEQEQAFERVISSPFLYSCCGSYLNLYKQFKIMEREGFKYPQIIDSTFDVKIKMSQPFAISRTKSLEQTFE